MAANLHTFSPEEIEQLARDAGFTDAHAGTASWAWVLTLGLNYYLVGEQPSARANRAAVIASAQKLYHRVHG